MVSHVASFPQRGAHCNAFSTKFAKCLPKSPPSVLEKKRKWIFSLSHTWLTGHVLCPASTLLTHARISIKIMLPVLPAKTPGWPDFQPVVDVEDLTFPPGWRGHACKAAQRRRTCPDLREKNVMVKIGFRAGQVLRPVTSFLQRGAR